MAYSSKKSTERASRHAPEGEVIAAGPAHGKPATRIFATVGDSLSLSFRGETLDIIKGMRIGTPASVVPALAARFEMSQDGLFEMLRLPRSTMKGRISKNAMLSASEQDRIYRAEQVWSRTVEVLEDEDAARSWIKQGNRSMGGEAPLSLLDTEVGYELVLDTLGRIEQGVVS